MSYTKGEWAIVALAVVYALSQSAGEPPGFVVGSLLGAGVLAVIIITGKRTWQAA